MVSEYYKFMATNDTRPTSTGSGTRTASFASASVIVTQTGLPRVIDRLQVHDGLSIMESERVSSSVLVLFSVSLLFYLCINCVDSLC